MPSPEAYQQKELSRLEKLLAQGAISATQFCILCVQVQLVVDNWV